jgi:hypothetical protein
MDLLWSLDSYRNVRPGNELADRYIKATGIGTVLG